MREKTVFSKFPALLSTLVCWQNDFSVSDRTTGRIVSFEYETSEIINNVQISRTLVATNTSDLVVNSLYKTPKLLGRAFKRSQRQEKVIVIISIGQIVSQKDNAAQQERTMLIHYYMRSSLSTNEVFVSPNVYRVIQTDILTITLVN